MMPHEFPVVLGRDFAGTIESVGDGVAAFAPGDRVAGTITALALGPGTIAESVVVDANSLVALPKGVTSVQAAAAALAGTTAMTLIDTLALTSEDVVLIAGASGGVGAFAVQLATAKGATVLATARPGEAADFVRGLGARRTVGYTGDLAAAVRSAAPDGVTAIVHAAGDPAALGALLKPGGRFASALGATAEAVGRTDSTVTPVMGDSSPAKLTALLDSVDRGDLSVPVARTYPLARAAEALADFSAHKLGKLVVTVP
jgi:NADPH:quinone reductase-like Zn-dependent oxidoreductase